MMIFRKVVLLLLTSCLFCGPACADEGVVNSVSYIPFPTPTTLRVRQLDDSYENMALKADIEAALKAAGFRIAEESNLILNFGTRDEIGAWSMTGRRSIIFLKSKVGSDGAENALAQVNIFDSDRGALLNKGQRRNGTSITTPSSYRIDFDIAQTTTGKQLWQGWAISDLAGASDGRTLVRRMVPTIVDTLGKTVRQKRFELRE